MLGRETFLGNFFYLIEVKGIQTYIFLIPRNWCLLITLDSSEMGIRRITGKYQEEMHLFRLPYALLPLQREWVSRI